MTGNTGYLTRIGSAVTCGHHTHSDLQFMDCLAEAWGIDRERLALLFLAMLMTKGEHDALEGQAGRLPMVRMMPAPAPAPGARRGPVRRRKSPTAGTAAKRHPIVRALLRDDPHATGRDAQDALARAGYHVSMSCARNDLTAARE
jgi:hypothetical protein